MYVDSHAHLDSPRLRRQRAEVLKRAREAGVSQILQIVCVGSEEWDLEAAVEAAESEPEIWIAAGVHPHDADAMNSLLEGELLRWARHPRVVGWGEIGLDFYYDNSPRQVQEQVFSRQLDLAREMGKPVIIHSRDAGEETCRILEERFARAGDHPGGVMHCFTYGPEIARRCLEMDFYLSFGGIVTFPRSEELRKIARLAPEDRFLIETDAPYLAPVPHRGQTNEPAWVVKVAQELARIRGVSPAVIAEQSTRNFERLFGLGYS